MCTPINQIDENTYVTDNGKGTKLTLINSGKGYWTVCAENAATRAYGSLGSKTFWSLEEVEAKYKAFRGITSLV